MAFLQKPGLLEGLFQCKHRSECFRNLCHVHIRITEYGLEPREANREHSFLFGGTLLCFYTAVLLVFSSMETHPHCFSPFDYTSLLSIHFEDGLSFHILLFFFFKRDRHK